MVCIYIAQVWNVVRSTGSRAGGAAWQHLSSASLSSFQVHPRSLWLTRVTRALPLCPSTSTGPPRSRWTVGSVLKDTRSTTHPWHLATISSPLNTEDRSTSWAARSKLKSQVCLTVALPSDLWISHDKCLDYVTNVAMKMLCHLRACCSVYVLHKSCLVLAPRGYIPAVTVGAQA